MVSTAPSIVQEDGTERGEHAGAAVGAGGSAEREDDPAGVARAAASTMASPDPRLEASSGASVPPGRVCSPQVLATSMTAVVPSNAAMVGCSSPVARDGDRDAAEPDSMAAWTLPSPPSASGSPV